MLLRLILLLIFLPILQMEKRQFENKYPDYSPKLDQVLIHNNQKLNTQITQYVDSQWESHFKNYNATDDYSVYTGSGGIALLKFLKSNQAENEHELLEEAKQLIPIKGLNKRKVTFICGDAGPLALAAVIEHKLGNHEKSKKHIDSLVNLSSDILNKRSNLPNEVLYGRSGYLYALLFINKHIGKNQIKTTLIKEIVKTILLLGQEEAKSIKLRIPLMYSWHDKNYLGAAHGLSGIMFMVLQAYEFVEKDDLEKIVKPTIDFLASIQFPSGNFPSSLGNEKDRLIQWCHGAPGFVSLFCLAHKVFNCETYLNFALHCGEIVWRKGLLSKGYSICHGVAGNAYTFLTLFRHTQDNMHLYRACRFAEWCINYTANHEYHYPDRPYSLFEGLAGRLYFLIDLQNPLNAKFPAYEL